MESQAIWLNELTQAIGWFGLFPFWEGEIRSMEQENSFHWKNFQEVQVKYYLNCKLSKQYCVFILFPIELLSLSFASGYLSITISQFLHHKIYFISWCYIFLIQSIDLNHIFLKMWAEKTPYAPHIQDCLPACLFVYYTLSIDRKVCLVQLFFSRT